MRISPYNIDNPARQWYGEEVVVASPWGNEVRFIYRTMRKTMSRRSTRAYIIAILMAGRSATWG